MLPSQENWSPSEGNFKPLDKAFSTIVHGRLVGPTGFVRLAGNNISKTVLYNVRKFYDIQFKNIQTNVF